MYFEAELKGRKYKIDVSEGRQHWHVTLEEVGREKEVHRIPKAEFMRMDDAVCFLFQSNSYMVDVVGSGTDYMVFTRGSFRQIRLYNDELLLHESLKGKGSLGGSSQVNAGMPGKIVKVFVKAGDKVSAGQVLLVMEAMKMENDIKAPADVVIKDVRIKPGDSVEAGAVLVTFES